VTGIVRDTKGRKMSKSLGNSPDPIDIIGRSGADAFRFTLMMLSPPGQDIMFDESKVEVGKHFANKIWNAARFVLGQEAPSEGEAVFGWEDRWIQSRLARRSAELEGCIDAYRFDEASRILYDFLWHEYCDWYLELSKAATRQGGARARGARATARGVLGASMILLHPTMPFITEEIWSMLAPEAPMLAAYRFPGVPADSLDAKLEADVAFFQEIVTAIRNLRQSFNISPGKPVNAVINCEAGRGLPARLEAFREQMRLLAKVEDLTIADGAAKPPGSAAAGLSLVEIYLPLKGVIDIESEKARLGKELEKISRECDKVSARLEDVRFVEKAPPDVVEQERNRYNDMSDKKRRLARILEDLG